MKPLTFPLLGLLICLSDGLAQSRLEEEQGKRSFGSYVEALVTFDNQSTNTVKVYWINFDGHRVLYRTLSPKEEYTQSTYLNHPWVVTDAEDNGLKFHLPTRKSSTVVITDSDWSDKETKRNPSSD